MDISFRVFHRTLFIQIYGAFDYAKSLKVRELLQGIKVKKYSNVLVNLAQVSSIDSSGLGFLASLARQVEQKGGCIRLKHPPEHLHQAFQSIQNSEVRILKI